MTLPPDTHSLSEELRRRIVWATRVGALLGILLIPPGIVLDWVNDPALAPQFALVRLAAAAACGLFGALTFTRIGSRHPSVLFAAVIMSAGLALVPALFEGPGNDPTAFANPLFALTICVLIAAISAVARRRAVIREHTAKVDLARAVEETGEALALARYEREQSERLLRQVTQMRQERITWLENLARFLRHELKNQIVAVGTSINLAQDGDSLEGNRIYLERAERSLNRMRELVTSATEATSLEMALQSDRSEQVDLSALVADRVLTFQQLHPSIQLSLNLIPGLSIEGSEERLVQLLDKLMNNAVEHVAPDGSIRVGLRRGQDDWREMTVENEGDPLPDDVQRIFEAFVSSQSRPENLGLGLFVARSIARNHRGTITAESLPDRGGARFIVRFPADRRSETRDPMA